MQPLKKSKLLFIFILLSILFLHLVSCDGKNPPNIPGNSGERQTVRLALGEFSIFFGSDTPSAGVTLADGVTYYEGDQKPVLSAISEALSIDFEECDNGADLVLGNVAELSLAGAMGEFLNIADYLGAMPNFSDYLDENPLVRLSISADEQGAFYILPCVSGAGFEELPIFNADVLTALLDGEGEFIAVDSQPLPLAVYTPYMPTFGSVSVKIMSGGRVSELLKNYDVAGNIIELMNYEISHGGLTGEQAVNMLRRYIDDAYGGFYGTRRSELFLGESAAWDADELVALLRCAKAVGTDGGGIFAPTGEALVRLTGALFSAPELLCEDYLYLASSGELCDARRDEGSYEALARMRAMIDEGLITDSGEGCTVSYGTARGADELGSDFVAALPPLTNLGGEYLRVLATPSVISDFGFALSSELLNEEDKLSSVLALVDYLFTDEGSVLASYGTSDFYDTAALAPTSGAIMDAERLSSGNMTEYYREYVGSGLLVSRGDTPLATTEQSDALARISSARALGLISEIGRLTDEGEYLPSTPIDMYTAAEYVTYASSSYRENYSDIFEGILNGDVPFDKDSCRELLQVICSDLAGDEYVALKSAAYSRYLRCYKKIMK